jgi:hypothetical protein
VCGLITTSDTPEATKSQPHAPRFPKHTFPPKAPCFPHTTFPEGATRIQHPQRFPPMLAGSPLPPSPLPPSPRPPSPLPPRPSPPRGENGRRAPPHVRNELLTPPVSICALLRTGPPSPPSPPIPPPSPPALPSPPLPPGTTVRVVGGGSGPGWMFGRLEVLYDSVWGTVWCVWAWGIYCLGTRAWLMCGCFQRWLQH